jgi:hypothetical protein
VGRLSAGGVVEFDAPRSIPSDLKTGEPAKVGTRGPLSPAQKSDALAHFGKVVIAMEQKYRGLPAGTEMEMLKSVEAAMEFVLYSEALAQVQRDEVWTFIQGVDHDSYNRAVRNMPRGWIAVRSSNVARTDDGQLIDIIAPIDPNKTPALKSLIEQQQELLARARKTEGR